MIDAVDDVMVLFNLYFETAEKINTPLTAAYCN